MVLLGCFTCRLRRKKCDEGKGQCKACRNLGLKCEYKRPMWWGNNEQRKQQKENIKTIIKRTKLTEKTTHVGPTGADTPPGLTHSLPNSATYSDLTRTRAPSIESQYSLGFDYSQPHILDQFDPYQTQQYSPPYDTNSYPAFHPAPYEVDIKTERQTYVNDVPTRKDSTISTFSTFQPPTSTLTSFLDDEWLHGDMYESGDMFSAEENLNFNFFDFSHGVSQTSPQALIQVDDCDRPLLDHFIDNVLRLIFPILEVNQHGSARSEVILPALESNKCYLHCCLSIAAIHLKSTQCLQGLASEQIDEDIMRHRYATISELCEALQRDTDHQQILEATLGMIFFQCSVGGPDDSLPDIAWHQHFEAGASLVRKLELPHAMIHSENATMHPPFNMTLTSWIDILGATMLARSPVFAHVYREKNEGGSSSGLCELMGCDDKIMYLISEIACLDGLKTNGGINDMQLCGHVKTLSEFLNQSEPLPGDMVYPYSSTGAIRPKQLSKNMTAIFRIAARVYLCSLIPGTTRNTETMFNLINRFTDAIEFIPSGPDGFDRSLVWPLLIAGSMSAPGSSFRAIFANRIALLGEHAGFGSFGRMVRLLQEVWHQSGEDGNINPTTCVIKNEESRNVHWRDVMQQKGWDFLLI